MLGIDISSYQDKLNLLDAKNSGVGTVIIKATQGNNYKNPCLQKHVDQAKQLGLNFGLYHYYDKKYGTAEQQAEYFCNTIKGLGYNIIPVLDFEEAAQIDKVNNIHRFMDYCTKALGVTPILYTYASYLSYLDSSTYKYKLWVAFYMSMSSALKDFNRCKQLYPIVNNYQVCGYQYASCWKINGYGGNLDVDEFYDNAFIGSSNVINSNHVSNNTATQEDTSRNRKWRYKYDTQIVKLQQVLNSKGFNLAVDGLMGEKTYAAVTQYTINQGDRGELTRWVQMRLNTMQYNAGVEDGIAGKNTMAAIARFQQSYHLGVGYLGGGDWYYLTNR